MNILTEIKNDHELIRKMTLALTKTTEEQPVVREKVFAKLKALLETHARCEEEVLYTALLKNENARDDVLEGYEEHHVLDLLLNEMSKLSVTDERWSAKLEVLRESLFHHLDEEESDIFQKASAAIQNERTLQDMGDYFRSLSENLKPKVLKTNEAIYSPILESKKPSKPSLLHSFF